MSELDKTSFVRCPECAKYRYISEWNAFGGKDKLRVTLALCGHVVPKEGLTHVKIEEVLGSLLRSGVRNGIAR